MEKPRATLELRYQMVEPYLTVFSGDIGQEIIEMKEKVSEYSERQGKTFALMVDLQSENQQYKIDIEALKASSDERLARIAELETKLDRTGDMLVLAMRSILTNGSERDDDMVEKDVVRSNIPKLRKMLEELADKRENK